MKNKIIKFFSIFIIAVMVLSVLPVQTTFASTKYEYIANGEKDILGFKISGLQQIEDCDTIEIVFSSSKNIVEFNTSTKVACNSKDYAAGTHKLTSVKNVAFVYNIEKNDVISTVVYIDGIDDASCPLEIRYCKDDAVVEKINMTLVASFYNGVAEGLRTNKETSTGSLIQEDVVVSRPNEPIQSSTTTVAPTTSTTTPTSTTGSTTVSVTTANTTPSAQISTTTAQTITESTASPQNCKHESTSIKNYREATEGKSGYTGDVVCDNCQTVMKAGTEIEKLPANNNGISLPIINKEESALSHSSLNNNDNESILVRVFDLVHSLKQEHFLIAICISILCFILCLVLISVFSRKKVKSVSKPKETKKIKKVRKEKPAKKKTAPKQKEAPTEAEEAKVKEDVGQVEEAETLLSEETVQQKEQVETEEAKETKEMEEVIPEIGIVIDDDGLDNDATEEESNLNEEVEEEISEEAPIISEEPQEVLPEIPLFDEYNAIMMTTLPAAEIEKILYDFNDMESDDDVDEYSNIVNE